MGPLFLLRTAESRSANEFRVSTVLSPGTAAVVRSANSDDVGGVSHGTNVLDMGPGASFPISG